MAGMESGLNMSHPNCIPSGLENVEPLLMNDPCAPPRNVYAENVYVTYRSVSYDLDIFQSNSYPALVLHSVRSFRDPSMMYDVNVFSSVLPSDMVSRACGIVYTYVAYGIRSVNLDRIAVCDGVCGEYPVCDSVCVVFAAA